MRIPLADRMRPKTLEDVTGQRHILGKGKALQNIIESGKIPNLIFYGPAGVGKTTVARIIAERSDMRLHKLNRFHGGFSRRHGRDRHADGAERYSAVFGRNSVS